MNRAVFEWVFGLANRSVFLDSAGIFLAKYLFYFLIAGVVVYLFLERDSRRRWFVLGEAALSAILARGILTETIRFFYDHPRPFDTLGFAPLIPEAGNSFPSGHAAFLFAISAVFWLLDRRWGNYYFVLSALNALGRVFVGVHWPLDILGGAAIGILSAWFMHLLLKRYFPKSQTAKPPP